MQCHDITYDVTASFNDVTLANKMTHFGHTVSKARPPKIAQNGHKKNMSNVATVHQERWVFCTTPHIEHSSSLPLFSKYEVNVNVCKSIQPLLHPLTLNFGEFCNM